MSHVILTMMVALGVIVSLPTLSLTLILPKKVLRWKPSCYKISEIKHSYIK